jgi:hypothetical protein
MILNISEEPITVIENGTYRFQLVNYPHIADYELNSIITFIWYEKSHGRETEVICKNKNIISVVNNAVANLDGIENVLQLEENKFVYHATNFIAARKILSEGKLLSATKVYSKTGGELAFERRRSSWSDPADYFEYIMFCDGDNPTGDYVVLSENFPSDEDLENGNYNAGVRFYFRNEDIIQHPEHTFDGYHAVKVKNEILLFDYLYACIIPEQYKDEIENHILLELMSRVHYLSQSELEISKWNQKVYDFVSKL